VASNVSSGYAAIIAFLEIPPYNNNISAPPYYSENNLATIKIWCMGVNIY